MATGIVTNIDSVGFGTIAVNGRRQLVEFRTDPDGEIFIGDRVRFDYRTTPEGVVAQSIENTEQRLSDLEA